MDFENKLRADQFYVRSTLQNYYGTTYQVTREEHDLKIYGGNILQWSQIIMKNGLSK